MFGSMTKGVVFFSVSHSQVLFPLLEKVHAATREASTSSLQSSALLIHHTRDSAKKQWAETQVLTLSGTGELGEGEEGSIFLQRQL